MVLRTVTRSVLQRGLRAITGDGGSDSGDVPTPPSGFSLVVDDDGNYIVDDDGNYLISED